MIEGLVKDVRYKLPIYGGSADVKRGAFVMKSATPGTSNGSLIKASGNNGNPNVVGRLQELHSYATTGDTLIDGTSFVTHVVGLVHPWRVWRMAFDPTSVITCTQAVSSATITVTSLEDDIDASFLYVQSGLGAGQTNYLTAAAAGSATLKAAFGTSLDTTSKFLKILPKFHDVLSLNSDGTMIASQAAVGAMKAFIVETYIERNGKLETLNPVKHAALNLSGMRTVKFFADVAFRDTAVYTVD